jgi:hypothetical protein
MKIPDIRDNSVWRTDTPDTSEFGGSGRFQALAVVGIPNHAEKVVWDLHYRIIAWFWNGEPYKVGCYAGQNEHGVAFQPLRWLALADIETEQEADDAAQ